MNATTTRTASAAKISMPGIHRYSMTVLLAREGGTRSPVVGDARRSRPVPAARWHGRVRGAIATGSPFRGVTRQIEEAGEARAALGEAAQEREGEHHTRDAAQ